MVGNIKLLDKVHLQKYIYLINSFLLNKINASVFEEYFLSIRREDNYWLSGSFNKDIGSILDSIFLDIDEYNSEELYEPMDHFNINEDELRKRLNDKLANLTIMIS